MYGIGHVRYINIITWLRGFQDKPLCLMLFSLYPSLFWELRDKRNVKNLQPRNHVRILIYRTWSIDTPYVLLQDRTPIPLRNSSGGTEFLHDNNLTKELKRNALESQISLLKDRMDDIEEHQTRSLQSKKSKVGDYISV